MWLAPNGPLPRLRHQMKTAKTIATANPMCKPMNASLRCSAREMRGSPISIVRKMYGMRQIRTIMHDVTRCSYRLLASSQIFLASCKTKMTAKGMVIVMAKLETIIAVRNQPPMPPDKPHSK